MQVPEQFRYTESHEWCQVNGNTVRVGITEFAQSQLADLTFVDLPESGASFEAGDEAAVLESVKAAADVYAPVAGKVTALNEALEDSPELINSDPFGEGWLFELEMADASELDKLLDAAAYTAHMPQD